MITNVLKETLNSLINLYQSSEGKSIKADEIAEALNRNPGTIRNQMIYLRQLGLVKSSSGPGGGYKPTLKAYNSLDISVSENDYSVPIYKNGNKMKDLSVTTIEFAGVSQFSECEVSIKVLGSIKDFKIGDEIIVGPTPSNNLSVKGTIVGSDDLANVLLVDAETIRSIPKKTVGDIAHFDVASFSIDCSLKDAAKKLYQKKIDGAPVIQDGKVVGVFTLSDLVNAVANDKEYVTVGDLMSTNVVIVNQNLKIAKAIEIMIQKSISRLFVRCNDPLSLGIVTKTDLIDSMINFK